MTENFNFEEKGKLIKSLPEIGSKENSGKVMNFGFEPMYELGRFVSFDDKEFKMQPLEEIQCSERLKGNLLDFFGTLSADILAKGVNFTPLLIDFTLFDPDDKTGKRLYIAICSSSKKLISDYITEINANIEGNVESFNDNEQERGPVLTNNNIYKSPYFYSDPKDRVEENLKLFNSIQKETMQIYFGSFIDKRKNNLSIEKQKGHIEYFFEKIEEKLKIGLIENNKEQTHAFNTSLLVPLLRPAASYNGDKEFRFRGGGLFIYGNTDPKDNIIEISARIQHFFNRVILNESHTQMAYDYLKHEESNSMVHDFRTFLSLKMEAKLQNILNSNELTNNRKNELSEVIRDVQLFRAYLTRILEAYRNYFIVDKEKGIVKNNGVIQPYSLSDFKNLIGELNEFYKQDLPIICFKDEINDSSKCIKINKLIFENIFRNLYTNTIAEYNEKSISNTNRYVHIRCYISYPLENAITIEYYNKGLNINPIHINNFGIQPIITTPTGGKLAGNSNKTSTGLGGYFINNTLKWMRAKEINLPNETNTNTKRYIIVENDNEDIKFTFKFELYDL